MLALSLSFAPSLFMTRMQAGIPDSGQPGVAEREDVPDVRRLPLVRNHVADILLASEQEIIDAMFIIWQRMKIVMEPSSAVTLATILKNKELFTGKRVGLIITGGNVDLKKLPWY